MNRPKVFISYSHDSDDHRTRVLDLAQRLRNDGVEAYLDQFINGAPPEGWPRWMLNQLDEASHVICVCTETYYRRFRGLDPIGKGVNWEGAIITQQLYDSHSRNTKFIPAFVGDRNDEAIPEPLRSTTHYWTEGDYDKLYDAILGQAGEVPGPLGKLKIKNREKEPNETDVKKGAVEAKEPSDAELEIVFTKTAEAIEEVLATAPLTVDLLSQFPGHSRIICSGSGRWELLPAYREGGANLTPFLQRTSEQIKYFSAPRNEWDALETIVGGIVVLGMNPKWVWHQRNVAQIGPMVFPKYSDVVPLESGGKAQFLAAISSALADGCARLDRVFGDLDEKRLPDVPSVMPGIAASDRAAEVKRHFVRYVIGPSDEFDVDQLRGEDLNTLFNRVKQLFRLALSMDKDPYYAAGPRLARLSKEVRDHLDLSDLYLFVPDDRSDESSMMKDPIILLSLARRIHREIEAKRPTT